MQKNIPNSVEIEDTIIGAILLEQHCLAAIEEIIYSSEIFYKDANKILYKTILALRNKNINIDILSVVKELKKNGELEKVGGAYAITQLTAKISTSANVNYYAAIVYQDFIKRELIQQLNKTIERCYKEDDPFELLQETQNNLLKLLNANSIIKISTIQEALINVVKTIDKNQKTTNEKIPFPYGLNEIDKFTKGLQMGDLIIVAGETSQGKTAFALTIINNLTKLTDTAIAIYSLEMTKEQLTTRILAAETNISAKQLTTSKLEHEQLNVINNNINKIAEKNIFFDDSCNSDINNILRSMRSLVVKQNVKIILVDYLQLVGNSKQNANKEERTAEVARSLKNIARELNICVILLSQLSRDKSNPKPTLSRLRDSGQIEEAADIVYLIYRPEYYGRTMPEPFENTPNVNNLAYIDLAKGRNIGTKQFLLYFNKEITKFTDYNFSVNEININNYKFLGIEI